jgi:hypothetical protein
MAKCWARLLGGCDSISREHVISSAVFADRVLKVEGFAPSKFGVEKIGKGSLTAKMLCRSHNSGLANLDNEAAQLSRAISRIGDGVEVVHLANGALIERWLLKTTINMFSANWINGRTYAPGPALVEQAFGRAKFLGRSGLYVAQKNTSTDGLADRFSFRPLFFGPEPAPVLGGVIMAIGPIFFVLCLNADGIYRLFDAAGTECIDGIRQEDLIWHPKSMRLDMSAADGSGGLMRFGMIW